MKQTIKRMSCLLLAMCLLLTVVPFCAHAEQSKSVDFVLVLDCSGTMKQNDREGLAADACKMFRDLMPIQNARIAVIAFSYTGSGFDYEHFDVKIDGHLIDVLSPLTGEMSEEQVLELKNKIDTAASREGDTTPLGQGLAAGVDTLLSGGSSDGNACVILLSDGGRSSKNAYGESDDLMVEASMTAKEHNWPIYCIELDYQGLNDKAGSPNRARLEKICELSGGGDKTRIEVGNSSEVQNALLTIYTRFMDIVTPDPQPIPMNTEVEIEVPTLSSETNIIISGSAVESVTLKTPSGVEKSFTGNATDGKWIVRTEKGSYFSVKVVLPEEGKWKVIAHGDENATAQAYFSSIHEMSMALIGSPDTGAQVTKNDTIKLQSYFTYAGSALNNSAFYGANAASAVVTSYDASGSVKDVKTFAMTGDTSGYHLELPVKELPSGVFDVQVQLQHDMFRSGEQTSNVLTYVAENLPLDHDESQVIDRSGFVNTDLEVIDLAKVFPNPDGDPIEYVVECVSDRNVVFEANIDDNDYLAINAGLNVGTHQMQVKATDPDMTEPMVHDFTITVENRPLDGKKIPDQEVWVDYYDGFPAKQDPSNTVLDIDLREYYTDPDGMELIYGDISTDVSGLLNASWRDGENGKVLHIEPLAKGDVVLTTTVSDGIETVETKIEIEVVSGKSIYWATHWFYYAIAGAAVLMIALALLIAYKNKLVKGVWTITVTDKNSDYCTYESLNIVAATSCGKKHKFTLYELLDEISAFMSGAASAQTAYRDYLVGDAAKIELVGTYGRKGCAVQKIPSTVTVKVNSLEKKKVQISSGRLTFEISGPGGNGDKLTVTMDLI